VHGKGASKPLGCPECGKRFLTKRQANTVNTYPVSIDVKGTGTYVSVLIVLLVFFVVASFLLCWVTFAR
jgi:hypothetical protein